jgi:hypothetical protein
MRGAISSVLAAAIVGACAPPSSPAPARSLAPASPALVIPPLPPPDAVVEHKPAPEHALAVRVFRQSPTACDPLRTRLPCIYKGETWCMFHDGEHADEPIACEAMTVPALVHRVRVCLDIENIRPRSRILIFHEDETEAQILEPTKSRRIRLCSSADRMWRVEIDGRKGELDWTKTTCHTLDARTMALRLGCDEPFTGLPAENQL